MTWHCFMVQPTGTARQSLRRYAERGLICPLPNGYHAAGVNLNDLSTDPAQPGGYGRDDFPHADPRWPAQCACGYAFGPEDQWQHNVTSLYTGGPSGARFTLHTAPIGALWYAPWLTERLRRPTDAELQPGVYNGYLSRYYWQHWFDKRPPIMVQIPGDWGWCIDSKSNNGEGWQITGEPPLITATPSIGAPRYHGFLRAGVLTDDLEGRTYP